tara:strand:+ start:37 stop:1314 length:1278 start_codon:yes stop_codon:yes gene_type:complete
MESIPKIQAGCEESFNEDTNCGFPFGFQEDYWEYYSEDCGENLSLYDTEQQKCCSKLGGAVACNANILAEEQAFDDCQTADDYVYKLVVEAPCGGCVVGEEPVSCAGEGISSLPDPGTDPPDPFDAVQSFLDARPTRDDFPLDEPGTGLEPGSDIGRKTGIPYGPFISDENSPYTFEYRITINSKGYDSKFVLPDGTELQTAYVSQGQTAMIPAGTRVVTESGAYLNFRIDLIGTPKSGSLGLGHEEFEYLLSHIRMSDNTEIQINEIYSGFLDLEAVRGFVRFYRKGVIQLNPASETGVAPITKGTDFGMHYDPETKITVVEVYDGTVDVTFKSTNEVKTISSSYGSEIKRVNVDQNGAMEEKTAIPKDEWEVLPEQPVQEQPEEQPVQEDKKDGKWITYFLIAILCIGIGYFIYKSRKFKKMN